MVTSSHHINLVNLIFTKFYLGPRCRNSKLKRGVCTRFVHSLTLECGNEIQHFHLDKLSSLIAQCHKYLFIYLPQSWLQWMQNTWSTSHGLIHHCLHLLVSSVSVSCQLQFLVPSQYQVVLSPVCVKLLQMWYMENKQIQCHCNSVSLII